MISGSLLAKLLNSPAGRQVQAAEERERQTERSAKAAEVQRLKAEQLAGLPAALKKRDDAEAAWKAAQTTLRATETALNEARLSVTSQSFSYGGRIAQLERSLSELAPKEIGLFLRELGDADIAELVKARLRPHPITVRRGVFAEEIIGVTYEERQVSAAAVVSLIGSLRDEAMALQFTDTSEGEIASQLGEMRRQLLGAE